MRRIYAVDVLAPTTLPHSSFARIALSPAEAAQALGVSRSLFYESILPELQVVRVGRRRLVTVDELSEWARSRSSRWDD